MDCSRYDLLTSCRILSRPRIINARIRLRVELTRLDQIDPALPIPGSQRVLHSVAPEWISRDMVSVHHARHAMASLARPRVRYAA